MVIHSEYAIAFGIAFGGCEGVALGRCGLDLRTGRSGGFEEWAAYELGVVYEFSAGC